MDLTHFPMDSQVTIVNISNLVYSLHCATCTSFLIHSNSSCALWRSRATATQWKTWSTSGKKAVLSRCHIILLMLWMCHVMSYHLFWVRGLESLTLVGQATWQCSQFQGDSYSSPSKPTLEVPLERIASCSVPLGPSGFKCASKGIIATVQLSCVVLRPVYDFRCRCQLCAQCIKIFLLCSLLHFDQTFYQNIAGFEEIIAFCVALSIILGQQLINISLFLLKEGVLTKGILCICSYLIDSFVF